MSEGAPDETEEQKAERLKQNLIDYSKWKEIQDEEEDEEAKEHRDEEEDARWDAFLESANTWTKDEESKFKKALQTYPEGSEKRWEKVAAVVGSRSKDQCKKKFTQDKKAAK